MEIDKKQLAYILGIVAALLMSLAALLDPASPKQTGQEPQANLEVSLEHLEGCELLRPVVQDGYLLLECVAENPPTPTPAPPDTPTPPPTVTPVITVTSTPTGSVGIEPYPDAPLCTDHDDRAYHTLWNEGEGCHYTHFHGDDPHELDDVFGTSVYAWFGGDETPAEISYPWQTPNENLYKHGGYIWKTGKDLGCFSQFSTGCVTDFRALFHGVGSVKGAVVANHSYWLEARVCVEDPFGGDPTDCAIYRGGGWQGPSRLAIDGRIVLDPEGSNQQRTFLHYFNTGNPCCGTWYNSNQAGHSGVVPEFGDMWDTVPEQDPDGNPLNTAEDIIAYSESRCPDEGPCPNNSSYIQTHIIFVGIPPRMWSTVDQDADGYADFFGYTDRRGEIQPDGTCTEIGLDCVPFRLEHLKLTDQYQYRGEYREYDLYFSNQPSGWIEFPILTPEG